MLPIDEDDLAEMRRHNRRLALAPRFGIRNRFAPMLIQSLLRLSQLGSDRTARKAGLSVEQRRISSGDNEVGVRVLRPGGSVRGVVLDIHGGGWAIGNARMNDALNAAMIRACEVAVVSVDYRLAGRAPIREIMGDCLAAARWLLDGGIAEYRDLPVVVVGESAGGHLAAATLLQLKRWPGLFNRLAGAVLYYGVYDLAGSASVRRAGADTLVLDGPGMAAGLQGLTPGMSAAERRQPPLSPLYGDLDGFPPALMFVGERDPLLDDTLQLAERWREVSEVELHVLPEAPHGFIHFRTGMAAKVLAAAHDWIRARLDETR
ncbi:alpha/beta hydrolase [Stenotrophomonas sp. MMGLT7]|uniref:alpha/beta hydrolase n=1 Tax=Stenotrophomonas sp. MMGLT7 TaxID=2901227 RepID=UPI001E31262B|nr:alpha/beta hydrolase [Stenotrophomonas sp. MMGLT7]MCD7097202.1 alpha/beta hydrolase [Stenotrophomonas sp. MMGLT7]